MTTPTPHQLKLDWKWDERGQCWLADIADIHFEIKQMPPDGQCTLWLGSMKTVGIGSVEDAKDAARVHFEAILSVATLLAANPDPVAVELLRRVAGELRYHYQNRYFVGIVKDIDAYLSKLDAKKEDFKEVTMLKSSELNPANAESNPPPSTLPTGEESEVKESMKISEMTPVQRDEFADKIVSALDSSRVREILAVIIMEVMMKMDASTGEASKDD